MLIGVCCRSMRLDSIYFTVSTPFYFTLSQ